MEAGVRRALAQIGKVPASVAHQPARPANRPRHRFVRDGEVPVVVLPPQREHRERAAGPVTMPDRPGESRLAVVEALLREERAAREHAEQALHAAQAIIRDLQTKLGHAVLARDEALEAVRAAEARMQESAAHRAAERQPPLPAPQAGTSDTPRRRGRPPKSSRMATDVAPARTGADTKPQDVAALSEPAPVTPLGKPAARPKLRQKPVKWWVEGWQSEFGF